MITEESDSKSVIVSEGELMTIAAFPLQCQDEMGGKLGQSVEKRSSRGQVGC